MILTALCSKATASTVYLYVQTIKAFFVGARSRDWYFHTTPWCSWYPGSAQVCEVTVCAVPFSQLKWRAALGFSVGLDWAFKYTLVMFIDWEWCYFTFKTLKKTPPFILKQKCILFHLLFTCSHFKDKVGQGHLSKDFCSLWVCFCLSCVQKKQTFNGFDVW